MDYANAFAISAAGMTVERTRVDIAALNLANANAIQTPGAPAYQPMRAVARSVAGSMPSTSGFSEAFAQGRASSGTSAVAWPEVGIEPLAISPRMVYEPGNPFANAKGFVAYTGVDTASEMMTMMSALRSYEANVVAMNTAKTMALRALDIGGGAA
jgi:flagellar basal-body rod protein FlgC